MARSLKFAAGVFILSAAVVIGADLKQGVEAGSQGSKPDLSQLLLADKTFEDLASELRVLPNTKDAAEQDRLLRQLAKLEPRRALDLARAFSPERRDHAGHIILTVWLHDAPRPAMAWAKANFPLFFQTTYFVDVCVDLRDTALFEEGLPQIPEEIAKSQLTRRLALEWTKVDPVFMNTWVNGLSARGVSGQIRDFARSGMLEAMARKSPDEAIRWIQQATQIDNNSMRLYYQALVQGMRDTGKLDEAEKFFGTQPANPDYNLAINVIVRELVEKAPERIDEWLSAVKPGMRVIPMFELKKTQPALAAQLWVKHQEDPNSALAMKNLESTLIVWSMKDRDAAIKFVDDATRLTLENRRRLRTMLLTPP